MYSRIAPMRSSNVTRDPDMPHPNTGRGLKSTSCIVAALCGTAFSLCAGEPGRQFSDSIKGMTDGKVQITFEVRSRIEYRNESEFGKGQTTGADFVRTRAGISYSPADWIRISALGQDARAPFLGRTAPGSMRDPFDLQESYLELFPKSKRGFGADFGRRMVQYGDTRLIGAPQWAYTARTYDLARAWWKTSGARYEILAISPIKPDGNGWNRPVPGDRVVGMYNTWNRIWRKSVLDAYLLRHSQNRPGGYTGPGRLRTDSAGLRLAVPVSQSIRITGEGILQRGRIGDLPHRAHAWAVQFAWRTGVLSRSLDISAEWKEASGGPGDDRSSTFDQLYPAAHDKLGHADLLGWRNIRSGKATAAWAVTRSLGVTLMYTDNWLADPRDAAYSAQGKAIARSASGTAGSHIGREADLFATWKSGPFTVGAGTGYFFSGRFLKQTTPGMNQRLFYLFQTYSF